MLYKDPYQAQYPYHYQLQYKDPDGGHNPFML